MKIKNIGPRWGASKILLCRTGTGNSAFIETFKIDTEIYAP